LPVAEAQSSTVQCLPVFAWMNNSRIQNPCLVSAYLQGVCTGGAFTVNPLPLDTHYTGPTLDNVNDCQCSTVTYSVVSACGVCQNRSIVAWSLWKDNCTGHGPFILSYPESIPSGTAVPAWAYLDVTTSDFFNPAIAESDDTAPESSDRASTSTSTVTSSGSSLATTTLLAPSQTSPVSGNIATHTQSNVGAIAGGVVGGVVVLGIIAGLVAFFLMRKPPVKTAASPAYGYGDAALNSPPPPMSQQQSLYGNPPHSENPGRIYDPGDPSTYPQSPPTPTIHTTNSGLAHQPAQPGYYSGIPEV